MLGNLVLRRAMGVTWLMVAALAYGCGGDDALESGSTAPSDSRADGSAPGPGEDGGAVPDGGDAPDAEPPAVIPYVDFDINHVLVTGQSNSVSNSGTPVLSTSQPYTNVMFDTGVMPMKGRPGNPDGACDGAGCTSYETPSALVPLVEGDRFFGYGVETAAAGLANQISHLAMTKRALPKHDVLVSIHGRSGNTYWCLRKPVAAVAGSTTNGACNYKAGYLQPFEQAMMEVASGKALAEAAGKSYVVRGVATIHGESDDYSWANPQSGGWEFPLDGHDGAKDAIADYADALVEWQKDYETSIQAVTGQTVAVPLFVPQISGWNHGPYSQVAQNQLDAHIKAPGKVVVVGPSYNLALDQGDCLHFTEGGIRHLGEYIAKVYDRVVFQGQRWEPVRPKSITRADNVITVQFHVPKPPLVLDQTLVAAAANEGFSYVDASGAAAPAITDVTITAPDTVQITLAATPTGADKRLSYAMNQVKGTCIGTPQGARGNLRDSDDTPSRNDAPLFNWAVHFAAAVP